MAWKEKFPDRVKNHAKRPSEPPPVTPAAAPGTNAPACHTTAPDSVMVPLAALSSGTCTSPVLPPGTVAFTTAHVVPAAGSAAGRGPAAACAPASPAAAPAAAAAAVHATRTMSCWSPEQGPPSVAWLATALRLQPPRPTQSGAI